MEFSQRLKQLRHGIGFTQVELAEKLGVTDAAVRAWELGRSKPRLDKLEELANILGTTSYYLLNGVQQALDRPRGAREPIGRSGYVPVMRLGVTHAGEPIEAILDSSGTVEVPEHVVARHPKAFILDVVGSCMNRRFPDGCVVLVDPDMIPRDGDAVVAGVDVDQTILRKYVRTSSMLILAPDSTEDGHEDMVFSGEYEDVRLFGTVVWFQAKEDVQR